ncbi:helix-turn-helix domain-containing protein [Burkholderia metallica]|uniref:helix-turn-helix domain-containing protein n=1 Tax=Burkholderia metallica TaxID=488729 RepID=UPI00158CC719|nr:helix-turn-helix transcriptional regulator [Burkholderia metallica]
MSVLYVYRCPACGHRGQVHHPDDSYDGAAATCANCYGPVALEWDGGVTFEVGRHGLPPGFAGDPLGPHATHPAEDEAAPTPDALKHLRLRHGRTQADVAACVGVEPRQVQRWEAGKPTMPKAAWQLLRREWGTRFREDFATVPVPTWGWDTQRDVKRHTIERGDVVHLQAIDGPLIVATVCVDRAYDALADVHVYGAIVTGVGKPYPAGEPRRSFTLGERVTFARANVIHLEQRAPRR